MAKSPEQVKKQRILKLANAVAKKGDCDVLLFNFGIEPGFDQPVFEFLRRRRTKRKNLLLFLTTEGGDADTAYRIARWFQDAYTTITIVVAGW